MSAFYACSKNQFLVMVETTVFQKKHRNKVVPKFITSSADVLVELILVLFLFSNFHL